MKRMQFELVQLWYVGIFFVLQVFVPSFAADYTSPGLGSYIKDPSDLRLENIQILSESPLPDGRVMLEVGADVRNLDVGLWEDVGAGLNETLASNSFAYLNIRVEQTNDVPVGALATNSEVISIIVNATDLAAATAEILAGTILDATAETVTGVFVDAAAQIPVENIQVVAQHTLSGGRVLLQVAAAVRNATTEVLREASINVITTGSALNYILPVGSMQFGDLATNGFATASQKLYLDVSDAALPSVRSNILSGSALSIFGTELWVFSSNPRSIDQATENAWRAPAESAGAETRLVFTNVTSFLESVEPGELLLENPSFNTLPHEAMDNPLDPLDDDDKVLADYLPFLVSNVTISSNQVEVTGRRQLLAQILKNATFIAYARDAFDRPVRDPYDPVLENTYTEDEEEVRSDVADTIAYDDPRDGRLADLKGLVPLPFHFNLTNLSDRVRVSGQMFFRQSGLKFEIKIRNFQLQRAVTRLDAGAVLNMLIEVEGKKEEDEPEEASKNLLPFDPFPPLTFNLGGVQITVQPELSLTAGIIENVPTSLTLPLQSSFLIGMEMGFDRSRKTGTNDGFFYEPFVDAHPLRVSDPTVFDELAMTIGAWAELEFGLKIGVGEGVSLQAGPSLAFRLENSFTLAPLSNPWWELDSGIDLIGRFDMNLDFMGFGSVELADAEASLHHFNIFHRDAGGPLIRGMRAAAVNTNMAGFDPIVGKNVRWGKIFQPREGFGLQQSFAFGVPGSSNELIVGGAGGVSGANSTLAKFGAKGELLWMKDTYPLGGSTMREGAVLADGSFFTAGTRGLEIIIQYFDRDGNRTWGLAYLPTPTLAVKDVAAATNRTGQPEFFVTGFMNNGVVTASDPVLLKFDAAGALVWGFTYQFPGDDEVNGITMSADGNLLLCGHTAADVAPSPHGTPDPGNVLKNAVASGLLMKVDAATGTILWAQAYASRWGMIFREVVEAPDGTIYAGGAAGKIITQTRPANLFAKFKPDGSLINHVLIGDDPDWMDELPNGGSSPYDTVTSLIWTPEGLFACGDTGLGQGTAGWVMGLTEDFGVKFYSVFDGDQAEDLQAIADTGDGLAVLGNSRSAYPLGTGGSATAFVMKLPWEGILRFHENTGLRTLFLQPRIYHSSGTEEFQILSSTEIPNAPPMRFANTFSSVIFSNAPITLTARNAVEPLKDSTNRIVLSMEKLDIGNVDDFESWAAYNRLPSDTEADTDGDGLINIFESYFGQNPWSEDLSPTFTITASSTNNQQTIVLEFERNKFASTMPVTFEMSSDLTTWSPLAGQQETVVSLDPQRELVRLSFPGAARMQFFRAVLR